MDIKRDTIIQLDTYTLVHTMNYLLNNLYVYCCGSVIDKYFNAKASFLQNNVQAVYQKCESCTVLRNFSRSHEA